MTPLEKRIKKYMAKWQKLLRLQDWRIKLIICPKEQGEEAFCGKTMVQPDQRCAIVKIMEPVQDWADNELEATVIHELLHLHFEPHFWGKDERRDVEMEASVDTISIVLMKLSNPEWVDVRDNLSER